MTSYPYISTLFKNVLAQSKAIAGRFYVCPKMGYEINSDVLGQVLEQVNVNKQYPLALMMPPRAIGDLNVEAGGWLTYSITMFFLQTSYYGDNSNISVYTGTALDTIEGDWSDMQIAAMSFMGVLRLVQKATSYTEFRVGKRQMIIQPISEIGIDRASGVRIDFDLQLPYGCEPLEDYDESNLELITVPA